MKITKIDIYFFTLNNLYLIDVKNILNSSFVRGEIILKKDNNNKDINNVNQINHKDETNSKEVEVGEDTTKYGEFISSYFAWITLPEQKDKAKKLENITKTNKDKKEEKAEK